MSDAMDQLKQNEKIGKAVNSELTSGKLFQCLEV